MIPKINSAHGSDTRNILNRAIDVLNRLGIDVQTLVAEGQLTPSQYSKLIKEVNGLIAKGEVKLNDLSSDTLAAIEGGEGTSFNLLSIPRPRSVSSDKTTFLKPGVNLFNRKDIESNGYISESGNFVENGSFSVSNFIPVEPNTVYSIHYANVVSIYDENYEFQGRINMSQTPTEKRTFTIPSAIYYVRLNVVNTQLDNVILNVGESVADYEPYKNPTLENVSVPTSALEGELDVGETVPKDGSVSPRKTTFITSGVNLFSKNDIVTNGYISDAGNFVEGAPYNVSNFIPVEPNETYSVHYLNAVSTYDEKFNFLGRVSMSQTPTEERTFTTSSNTHFVRINVLDQHLDRAILNVGESVADYEPYEHQLHGVSVPASLIKGDTGNESPQDYNIVEIDKMIEMKDLEDASVDGLNIREYTSADIFGLFDELVDEYPNYISKELAFTESSGMPSYKYKFIPEKVNMTRNAINKERLHFFFVAGEHGKEKAGVWCLYNAMKGIVADWRGNQALTNLRWDVEFTVMPIVNVYGYDLELPYNVNGVDINRNYPGGWVYAGEPHKWQHSGPSPASEIETQAVIEVLENERVDYFGNFHNYFTESNIDENYIIWNVGSDDYNIALSEKLITYISQKWKSEKPNDVPQEEGVFHGYASTTVRGSSPLTCRELGINGSIFEVRQNTMFEPGQKALSALTVSLGTDAQLNWVYQVYRNVVN